MSGVEDAGYEIRDTITWHYGSGFPKSLDVSKSIDKQADAEGDYGEPKSKAHAGWIKRGRMRGDGENNHDGWQRDWMDDSKKVEKNARKYIPATEQAKHWDGFKSALKPATEFVCLARSPLAEDTIAENVVTHGTGALNIDATRVEIEGENLSYASREIGDGVKYQTQPEPDNGGEQHTEGRYPSNVVFDAQQADVLDDEVGELGGGSMTRERDVNDKEWKKDLNEGYTEGRDRSMFVNQADDDVRSYGDNGGPSRYFYTSKASKAERTLDGKIDNAHPTVKPIDLMEWLVSLATAEEQIVLDSFAGSGTTCKAAKNKNRQFIGIEKQEKWADVARVRSGLPPDDHSHIRSDDEQHGLEQYQ